MAKNLKNGKKFEKWQKILKMAKNLKNGKKFEKWQKI